MSDAHLRQIERDAVHGDVLVRARMLVERVRVSALDRERLRLAAHLGDPAAVLALGADVPAPEDKSRWITRIAEWGQDALVRAMCAVARYRLPYWLEENPRNGRVETYLAFAERWVLCPCEPCAVACRDGELAFRRLVVMGVDQRTKGGRAVGYVQYALWFASMSRQESANFSYCFTSAERAAIGAELVPWVVGQRDPLRERVAARRRPRGRLR